MFESWREILKASLLGIGKSVSEAPALPGELGLEIEGDEAAEVFLKRAAAMAVVGLAGHQPAIEPGKIEPAGEEALEECSPGAGSYLGRMLSGEHIAALGEFLLAMKKANRRVPHHNLPDLLDQGIEHAEFREWIRETIGARGAWLMKQNPRWQYEALDDDLTTWETGAKEARAAAFWRLRRKDPQNALGLLEKTWATETPNDREMLVEKLAMGLSMADEAFLEGALDDRRKEVRKKAADLLGRLPQSRFSARMADRMKGCLTVQKGLPGKIKIEVKLPEACDKAMARDGIDAKPPDKTMGEKAWWLHQIARCVSPGQLEKVATPQAMIQAAMKTDFGHAIVWGWSVSAGRHGEKEWAAPLLEWLLKQDENWIDYRIVVGLMEVLEEPQRDKATLELIQSGNYLITHRAIRAMLMSCSQWSVELSRAVERAIFMRHSDTWAYEFKMCAQDYGMRMDPSLAGEIHNDLKKIDSQGYMGRLIDEFAGLVQFRHDMLKEINR